MLFVERFAREPRPFSLLPSLDPVRAEIAAPSCTSR